MAARDHLSPGQLRMFIPAKELQSYNPNPYDIGHGDGVHGFDANEFWGNRAEEASAYSLWGSVGKEGVKNPVNVFHGDDPVVWKAVDPSLPVVGNGHHRVASAVDHDPEQLVPVRHYDYEHHRFHQAVWDQQT